MEIELLKQIINKLDGLQQQFDDMHQQIEGLRQQSNTLQQGQEKLHDDVLKIKLKIENDLDEKIVAIQDDLAVIRNVTKDKSWDIKLLKTGGLIQNT